MPQHFASHISKVHHHFLLFVFGRLGATLGNSVLPCALLHIPAVLEQCLHVSCLQESVEILRQLVVHGQRLHGVGTDEDVLEREFLTVDVARHARDGCGARVVDVHADRQRPGVAPHAHLRIADGVVEVVIEFFRVAHEPRFFVVGVGQSVQRRHLLIVQEHGVVGHLQRVERAAQGDVRRGLQILIQEEA